MAHPSDGPASSLGCLGMCTEQCAVMDVNSKCLRNMFALDMKGRGGGGWWLGEGGGGVGGWGGGGGGGGGGGRPALPS
jgi:hypothetical protein